MKNTICLTMVSLSTYLLNQNWELIAIWLILLSIDIIIGVIASFKNGKYQSSKMKQGLLKKMAEMIVLFTVIIGQRLVLVNGIDIPAIANVFIVALSFKEIGSIFENSIALGVKIPGFITKWFKVTEDIITNQDKVTEIVEKKEEDKNDSKNN